MSKNSTFFSKNLCKWYLQNGRSLPWRETKNPYYIWLSEIILQQTRVAQGLPYYLKFIEVFPTVTSLARASESQVLKLWQGLGYYSRARNLHFTAKYVSETLNDTFPDHYKGLLKLKGIGDYTASAIASICFNEPTAVVDGNVYRVLSRVFGVDTPIDSTQGKKEFKQLAQLLIENNRPGTYNQAIMEFGARYCVPQNPDCESCIFSSTCLAYQLKKVSQLPVKLKKTVIKKHYFNYIIPVSEDNKTILEQRTEKGIWQNMYQFPLVESTSEVNITGLKELSSYRSLSKTLKINSLVRFNKNTVIHKLSHKHLYTQFWIASVSELKEKGISYSKIDSFPVPILIENFISEFSLFKD